MSCNTCGKSFSIFLKEHGCPGCGFSYCSKCLKHSIFLPKLHKEAKVCVKCNMTKNDETNKAAVEAPAAYLKRLESLENPSRPPITVYKQDKYQKLKRGLSIEDQQLVDRLEQLKVDRIMPPTPESVEQQIGERLKKLRGIEAVGATDDQVQERLSNLKGEPARPSAVTLPPADLRSDQQKSDDILRQYMQEVNIDASHKRAFDSRIDDIESRLHSLAGTSKRTAASQTEASESEDVEEVVRKLMEKVKAEAALEPELSADFTMTLKAEARAETAELPWCEICNEDAAMRCRGCRYLFCTQCFLEHKDDDLGCDSYEPYEKPKNAPA